MDVFGVIGVTEEGQEVASKYVQSYSARYDISGHAINDLKTVFRHLDEIKYGSLLIVEDLPLLKEDGKYVYLLEDKAYLGTCDLLLKMTRSLNLFTPTFVMTSCGDREAYDELKAKGAEEVFHVKDDIASVIGSIYRNT